MNASGIAASSPYDQPWLSLDEQVDHLAARGLEFDSREDATAALTRIGYFRLTGYLRPFLRHRPDTPEDDIYIPGTSLDYILRLVDADRRLRQIILDGVDRIEVSLRMRLGHTLGEVDPFAHLNAATFDPTFVRRYKYARWLAGVSENHLRSGEQFVRTYAEKYDGDLPIWALVELLGLGQLATMYDGLRDDLATPIANDLGVPDRDLLRSWLAAINAAKAINRTVTTGGDQRHPQRRGAPRPTVQPVPGDRSDAPAQRECSRTGAPGRAPGGRGPSDRGFPDLQCRRGDRLPHPADRPAVDVDVRHVRLRRVVPPPPAARGGFDGLL